MALLCEFYFFVEDVYKEFFSVELQAVLVGDEGETLAHLHDEGFDIPYHFFFHVAFIFYFSGRHEVHEVSLHAICICSGCKCDG